jgi:N-acetylmuramoyl-L-alanine amidase
MWHTVCPRIDELNARRQRWYKRLLSKKYRKRTIRYSLLVVNVLLLVVVVAFVAQKPGTSSNLPVLSTQTADDGAVSPLDELSSADIAVHVARVTRLPEATNVTNLADTVNAQLALTSSDNVIASKPQIVATALPSRQDIKTYIVKKGDSVQSIAEKFGVTSETIRWSNDLASNAVSPGRTLYISPVDGIIYTVKSGDTVASIANRFRANKEKLIVINDLEGGYMPIGQKIIIPDGVQPTVGAPATASFNAYQSGGLAFGSSPVYGYNGYDPGWCTWYAASRVAVPNNWGNANTWDDGARVSGWTVSSIPRVGAVAQSNAGWAGHVGVVESVKVVSGKYYIKYSDMNGLAGFGNVGYSGWVPANLKYENFIYR